MKKQLAAIMAATMMMGTLAACGGGASTATSATDSTVAFDDGNREVLTLTKIAALQAFVITPCTVQGLKLFELKKADSASPFPALTQIEVYGTETTLGTAP